MPVYEASRGGGRMLADWLASPRGEEPRKCFREELNRAEVEGLLRVR
jgi:hypothetical protein